MKLKASNSTIDKAKEAERIAKGWLEKRGFRIEYWHEGKASKKPYDILAVKKQRGKLESWAIDVKTGKKPQINIKNFRDLIDMKEIEYKDRETNEIRKFKHNIIGYALVIGKDVFLFGYEKSRWIAIKAHKTIRKRYGLKKH
ncbi:MAG: hypothetical protein QXL77_08035 [Candidatus Bathyarchaeia archaeon]